MTDDKPDRLLRAIWAFLGVYACLWLVTALERWL